jgi:hypothetical protein
MLDQSFSIQNLREIVDYENRKGLFLEGQFFPEVEEITKKIKQRTEEIRQKKGTLNDLEYQTLCKLRDGLKEEKEKKLLEKLKEVSEKITSNQFKIELRRVDIENEKSLYIVKKTPENYFAFKQVQYNISRLYKVKQGNRFAIVSQVKQLLGDNFPKYVLRIDIKDFYESVPHQHLLDEINQDNLLSFLSKKLIREVLKDYSLKSESPIGIPRGVGISAYLCELFMRKIDFRIQLLPTVTYYARYVDDIIIIFTPVSSNDNQDYAMLVKEIIEPKGLTINTTKTYVADLRRGTGPKQLEFLGYKFHFGELNQEIIVKLTDKKINKYKDRIVSMLNQYNAEFKYNPKRSRRLLLYRIKYLTGNTRLINNKNKVLIGIYFTHNLLTTLEDLTTLDTYLQEKIDELIVSEKLKNRLTAFRFEQGFSSKRFTHFSPKQITEILKVWKK